MQYLLQPAQSFKFGTYFAIQNLVTICVINSMYLTCLNTKQGYACNWWRMEIRFLPTA